VPKCIPGQSTPCAGLAACAGSQICKADGTFGACTCGGGGGAGGGGAMDGSGTGGALGGGGGGGGSSGGSGSFAGAGGSSGGRGGSSGGSGSNVPPVSCDPVSQTPCLALQRCAWVVTGTNNAGHSACLADAAMKEGAACVISSTGVDNCHRGTACVDGVCRTLCGLSPDTCGSGWACGLYTEAPFNPDGNGTTGFCEPMCNPLTQTRSFDQAPACGSPEPGSPSLGCYGYPDFPFTCSPAGDPYYGAGAEAPLAPDGAAYLNGCAPGYLPIQYASSDSTTIVCVAMCEPGPTSLQNPANAKGRVGSPHTCPAKGAGGSYECRYWWYLEDTGAATFPSTFSNTLGYCYDYTKFSYDRDGNGSLDTPMPSCTTLSSSAHTFDSYWTDDVMWGCAPVF